MDDILGEILDLDDGILLLEYSSLDHPERIFAGILAGWRERGVTPLIVDINDTLNIFVQNLRYAGVDVNLEDVPVIKERGAINVGNVVGKVEVVEDFDYHLANYARIVRKVPLESRKHTIVLGIEKFSLTFLDDPPKLERYFETITRKFLPLRDRVHFLFLNVDIASRYLRKSLEQDSDWVLQIVKGELKTVKRPGVLV
ncbi:hypothetical protein FH039_01120 [Thermococcus indicus]|uniref:KaiC-like domain-containing protein n=1 Tax=Thermococcus indicus TaxID=2586643 RepID=A0A4Y5SIA6_9EURY|nr:DUF257 family protein [Thermococcus indicus]QDA30493.1 hypothetical protein FH039_01120 [Thermococcus indicus]